MNLAVYCIVGCVLSTPFASAAAPQWGGSATVSSNYLLRGVSRSSNDPALSAEAHAQLPNGLFLAAWGSTSRVRKIDPTTPEISATLGLAGALNDNWSGRFSVTHYDSPWSTRPGFYRYDEVTADLSYRDRLFLSASFSPNTSRYAAAHGPVWHRNAGTYEAGYQQQLHGPLRGFVGVGYYDLSDLFHDGYWYSSIGASIARRRWQLDLSYVMPDAAARRLSYRGTANRRILATLACNF